MNIIHDVKPPQGIFFNLRTQTKPVEILFSNRLICYDFLHLFNSSLINFNVHPSQDYNIIEIM